MAARELLLVAFAGAVIRGALFARPPNVTYFIDTETCHLQVTWERSEVPHCTQMYEVAVRINGTWDNNSKRCLRNTSWDPPVPLGKEIYFQVKTSCHKVCGDASGWNDDEAFHVVQNGAAGTEARDLNCTWWNRNYMDCLWQAGEKASPGTSYKLFYWHGDLKKGHQCRNLTSDGSVFRCGFEWKVHHVSLITISIQGNSENIQPTCWLFNSINSLVKFDRPVITNLSKKGSEVFLQWTQPVNLYNLDYQVEVDSSQIVTPSKDSASAKITVEPNKQHTFRVRVKSEKGQWSDWSKEMVLDHETSILPILLLTLIPFCVALLLIILLIYLKRIKLLILPKIPDPEKILKHTFEEHNENQPTYETANNEDTHSLMIVEPAGNEK